MPANALARLGTMRFRSGYVLRQVVFSPEGKRIAVSSAGNGTDVFDVKTGHSRWEPSVYGGGDGVAFAPDGKLLAVAGPRHSVCLLDAHTGKTRLRFQVHDAPVNALAFSPDGKLLASSSFRPPIVLADVATGKPVRTLKGHGRAVGRLAFAPDGRTISSVSFDGTVRLWDVASGLERQRWTYGSDATAWCPDPVFTADGQIIIMPATCGVRLAGVRTGKEVRTLAASFGEVLAIALAPDGKTLALGNKHGDIVLWSVARDKEVRRWRAGVAAIQSLTFAPDGKLLVSAALWETTIRLWDPATGHERTPCPDHRGLVDSLAFSPDGRRLFSAGRDQRVCQWDVRAGVVGKRFDVPGRGPSTFALSADGQVMTERGASDTAIRLLAMPEGRLLRTLPGIPPTPTYLWALALSPDGRLLASGGFDARLVIRDTTTGKELHQLGPVRTVWRLAFSPDGKMLAAADGRSVPRPVAATRLYDVASGRELRCFDQGFDASALAFSPDSRLLAVGEHDRRGAVVWDVGTGKEVRRFVAREGSCYAAAFSPDGRLLATGGGDSVCPVHVWELASGGEARSFTGQRNGVLALAFSADGRTLASGGNDPILLWDLTGRTAGLGRHISTPADLHACWKDLASASPSEALDTVYSLVDAPALAVPFLRQHLKPIQPINQRHLARLVADLDSPRFPTRARATRELVELGDGVEAALRERVKGQVSAEVRRRLEQVLGTLSNGPHWLREVRALQVLEDIGTPEARAVMQQLAAGLVAARLTQEAKAALARLARTRH